MFLPTTETDMATITSNTLWRLSIGNAFSHLLRRRQRGHLAISRALASVNSDLNKNGPAGPGGKHERIQRDHTSYRPAIGLTI